MGKKVRMEKSIKNAFNFSKNPPGFLEKLELSESSVRFLESDLKKFGISLTRDEDRFSCRRARRVEPMSNREWNHHEGEEKYAVDLFLKTMMMIAPTIRPK